MADSYIDFGTPDANVVGAEPYTGVTWIDVDTDKDYWANKVYGYRWGDGASD